MARALVVVLAMLVAGLAGGYAFGELRDEDPGTASHATPLPAEPSVPIPAAPDVLPDPDSPPLPVNLPTRPTHLSTGSHGYGLTVDEPIGWRRNHLGEAWTWAVPENPTNTYVLRVTILAGLHQSVAVAKAARISALLDAVAQGNLEDFHVESQTGDTFIATYVNDGYRRVTMERIISDSFGPVDRGAYAVAAVTGREVDREGLTDLVQRTADSMVPD
jgi:hypothetical protein